MKHFEKKKHFIITEIFYLTNMLSKKDTML